MAQLKLDSRLYEMASGNLPFQRRGFIYFVRSSGFIKIGFTESSPRRRLKNIQIGNPNEVVPIKSIRGTRITEAEIHAQFAGLRVRGEWFKATDELLAAIEAMR